MKKYRIHFPQTNETWIEVEASTPLSALHKAEREMAEYQPIADTIEYPSGDQRDLETSPLE